MGDAGDTPLAVAPQFAADASIVVVGGGTTNLAPGMPQNKLVATTSVVRGPGPGGLGWFSDGTGPPFRNAGKVPKFEGPRGLTLVYVFSSTDTSGIQYVAGTLNTGTNYGETLTVNRKSDFTYGAGWLLADMRADAITSSTAYSTAAATTFFDGKPHCVVTQWTVATPASAAVARMWVDGVEQTLTNASPFAHSQAAGLVEFDYYLNTRNLRGAPGANSINGRIYFFARLMSAQFDGKSLSLNPYQIVQGPSRRLWLDGGGASVARGLFLPPHLTGLGSGGSFFGDRL